ncbi:lipid A export permease/ATP-binding protein MsbA [Nitrosococcus oceani]|uniref:ATP-dependent lipid A-core flippase n=2 Tax=Nitrosococcus oceani TaxID=1229 RepID=MSBA_NITOC|nr:lipid A export permease/ATP-binding protein MsbA [Nitrosococcus oceani]Q3J7R8.1 RecName: Full=ATP-dependent lipid A-core flippase; AltName: Full=Lipid A export ATP-binding/permease protein MsbA [Nitrosococcus oceani ATCC 19707]ABA59128.1 Lipid A export ATP-binding/permease protein MsbA [Nitrosococcus oceani ATCC 19707]KFI18450.1 lipid transporter ATP-binding/permease [Nitrosococcus oceani C-27]KFI21686.1 lipid transporter ATP-binding/permease [Nitrosococcus oceani]
MTFTPSLNSGLAVYRRLLSYTRPYRWIFAASIITMAIYAATETGLAALMKPLMDGSFIERDPATIQIIPLLLIGLFVIRGGANFITQYGLKWVARRVVRDLREQMFCHLLALPARYYDQKASGQLLAKLIYDVEQVSNAATDAILTIIRDSLTILGLLAWMAYLNGLLTLIILVTAPLIALIIWWVSHRFRRISRKIQNSMGDVSQVAQETIEGHREVKIFGGQTYEAERFDQVNEQNRRQTMKMAATDAISQPVVQLIAVLGLAGVIHLATRESMLAQISVGTFISFITAMMLLLGPVKRLTKINGTLQRGIAAAQSIFGLLAETPEADRGQQSLRRARGAIRFEHLSFCYEPAKGPVLENIDLEIKPYQTIALVGHSGSGKSTLVSLLARFYETTSGRILIDEMDIQTLRLTELRRQIALVSQQIILFNDTIAHNIAYGSYQQTSKQDIIRAAEAAHAMEFINRLPDGLDTVIGEKGVLLSGGQRQRLAIARALLKDAPILILDEATASLDTEAERHIQAALETLMRQRTTLVIAHRLSTVENADQIIVLHQGQIIERGTHSQLLARESHYAGLYRLQFRHSHEHVSPLSANVGL